MLVLTLLLASSTQLLLAQSRARNVIIIDSCIQIALLNNYELKVYEQNESIALKQYSIQQSKQLPTINLSSGYMLTNQFDDSEKYNNGYAGIQVYQPVWQNGKIRSIVAQAGINAEAAEIQFSIDRSNVVYYTTESYINVLRANRISILINNMVKQFAITVDAAKERFMLGASKRSDVLKAEAEYSNIQYLAIQVETSGKIAMQNLQEAMGFQSYHPFETDDFLQESLAALENTTIDSLVGIAGKYLPELKLINKQIQQQEVTVSIERKNQFPEIGAFSSYNWTDNPLYTNELYGEVGISLRLNIYSGSQQKNTIALETVRLQQLNLKELEILQSVNNEIRVAQLKFIEAQEKISNAKARVKSSKDNLEVTKEEYMQGLSSMLELIDAQYTDFGANRSLINAQAEYHLAAARLTRKTGLRAVEYATK
ncbi:MAG: TolC family protein [Gammaproteobacteria bacterium]|nr:TolC family protein [Gammaproteobacteria bacterium]